MLPLIDPTAYSPLWWVAIGVLVALFLGWLIAIPFVTRGQAARSYSELLVPREPPRTLQDIYRDRILALGDSLTAQEITEREMHLQLSELVREFVTARTGITAKTMTYSDLVADERTEKVAFVIAQFYHPAFSSSGSLEDWNPAEEPQPITLRNALLVVDHL